MPPKKMRWFWENDMHEDHVPEARRLNPIRRDAL